MSETFSADRQSICWMLLMLKYCTIIMRQISDFRAYEWCGYGEAACSSSYRRYASNFQLILVSIKSSTPYSLAGLFFCSATRKLWQKSNDNFPPELKSCVFGREERRKQCAYPCVEVMVVSNTKAKANRRNWFALVAKLDGRLQRAM